jgi:glycosyltransferase involved in cell wall biosynthesis
VRALVVATEYPWPLNSGSRRRLASTLEALRACGSVDLFSVVAQTRIDFAPVPDELGLERVHRVTIDDGPPGVTDYMRALRLPWAPFELPLRDRATVHRALGEFAQGADSGGAQGGRYDLVWYFQVRAWVLAGEPCSVPSIVDIDDLEDQKILARAALPRQGQSAGGRLRHQAGLLWTRADARRWQRLHGRIADRVAAAVVCSELDARRSGLPGVRVIPNGYPPPPTPVGRDSVSSPPVVVFQGTLRYPPNADAARFLVEEVGSRLRALVPDAQVRLVGVASPSVAGLADPPAVTLVGQVPDISTELAAADLVVIPLRYGSGTRVKILEAFAHRIPVVSTTIGAEGLDVTPGQHLLVADGPDAIARACAQLLEDVPLRRRIVDEAHALYLARYQSSRVQGEVGVLAREVAGS